MNPEKVDHVWIRIQVKDLGRFLVVINTFSIRNHTAGFDARIAVGRYRTEDATPPPAGLEPMDRFDYGEQEKAANIFYEHLDREGMETLLLESSRSAAMLTAWGDFFCRNTMGIHQVHSRRQSCAVPQDVRGRDGGVTFYYAEPAHSVTFFFKFCGQP